MADYDSAFETESERNNKRKDLSEKVLVKKIKSDKAELINEFGKEEGRNRRYHFLSLDAYSRHKILVNQYILNHPGSTEKLKRDTSRDKTEYQLLKEHHRFLWDDTDLPDTWSKKLAKKYYDKLFKEYCICDLNRYKENKIALRWRTEQEVIDGKGQFVCGDKQCKQSDEMRSWEVNFAYVEHGQKKNALVKLRLCPDCSYKLNYHHKRKEVKKKSKHEKLNLEKQYNDDESNEKSKDNEIVSDDRISGDQTVGDQSVGEQSVGDRINEKCTKDNKSADNESEINIWEKQPDLNEIERPIDEEFDDYLSELLL